MHSSSVMSQSPTWCPPRWISHTQAPEAAMFLHLQEQRRTLLKALRMSMSVEREAGLRAAHSDVVNSVPEQLKWL